MKSSRGPYKCKRCSERLGRVVYKTACECVKAKRTAFRHQQQKRAKQSEVSSAADEADSEGSE